MTAQTGKTYIKNDLGWITAEKVIEPRYLGWLERLGAGFFVGTIAAGISHRYSRVPGWISGLVVGGLVTGGAAQVRWGSQEQTAAISIWDQEPFFPSWPWLKDNLAQVADDEENSAVCKQFAKRLESRIIEWRLCYQLLMKESTVRTWPHDQFLAVYEELHTLADLLNRGFKSWQKPSECRHLMKAIFEFAQIDLALSNGKIPDLAQIKKVREAFDFSIWDSCEQSVVNSTNWSEFLQALSLNKS